MKKRFSPAVSLVSTLLPLLLAPIVVTTPSRAEAQAIQKCDGPDGTTIFTDKPCSAFGATLSKEYGFDGAAVETSAPAQLREPPQTMTEDGVVGNGFAINGCARTQGELIAGVREAMARGDVNRLANYYHWTGMETKAAFAVMDRLDTMARNTLASAQFDYPMPSYDYALTSARTDDDSPSATPTASLSPTPAYTQVAYHDGPSTFDGYRGEHADVGVYNSGIVDASTPLSEAKPAMPSDDPGTAVHIGGTNAETMLSGSVDASTPLGEARAMTLADVSGASYNAYNPRPTALRVNYGGGSGQRFRLTQNAGCWFIAF